MQVDVIDPAKTVMIVVDMQNDFVAAGAIAQTIWNLGHGQPAEFGLKDVDLIYFDEQDLSFEPRPVMRDAFVTYFNIFR
jgi:hypothetical protein